MRKKIFNTPDIIERLVSAARRIENGHGIRQIPANPADPDIAIHDAMIEIMSLRAQLEQQVRAVVPDGWKLVPINPTDAMYTAWLNGKSDDRCYWDDVYVAMLNAAPPPPAVPAQYERCSVLRNVPTIQTNSTAVPAGGVVPNALQDFVTHRTAWIAGLQRAMQAAESADAEDYWHQELGVMMRANSAFDRYFAALLSAQPQPEVGHGEN